MADFVAVLKKTIDGMGETTPETRSRVYDKARSTIAAKLAAIDPPPSASLAERQTKALEDAIATVEQSYAKPVPPPAPAPAADPLSELENIFSSIDRNRNQPSHASPSARAEPAGQPPKAAAPVHVGPLPPSAVSAPAAPVSVPAEKPRAATVPQPEPNSYPDEARRPEPVARREEEFSPDPPREAEADSFDDPYPEERKRGRGGLIAAVVALLALGAAGYGVWLNKDAFKGIFSRSEVAKVEQPAPAVTTTPAVTPPGAPAATEEAPKFTQRLTPEGKEIDPGLAGGETTVGEGTSVAALTTPPPAGAPVETPAAETPAPDETATPVIPPATPATPAQPADQAALAVGQKAIFYEERTSISQGSAEPGTIVWSVVQESPGGDAPPEPAIRAEATIPGKDVHLRMTIRRNADETLPASHIIEMLFLTPDGFEGGGIDNILRVSMKSAEQDAGNPLIGIPAKIADGFFLVALNDTKADEAANMTLLRNQDWIDVPVVYKSGRRALLTMEKGIPGEKVFDEAIKAWQAKTAG